MRPSLVPHAIVLLSCAPAPLPDAVDLPPPPPDTQPATSDDTTLAFNRCRAALVDERTTDGPSRARTLAIACASLYTRPACRDAWLRGFSPETPPEARVEIVTAGCREAYCPTFPQNPACNADFDDWSNTERAAAWSTLRAHILELEIGPARAKELRELFRDRGPHQHGIAEGPTAEVTIDGHGVISLGGAPIDEPSLENALRAMIDADGEAKLELFVAHATDMTVIRRVLDAGERAGFKYMSLRLLPQP